MAARRRRVEWTARAQNALDDAVGHIASDSPAAAERLLLRILDAAASLSELTERGRIVPELEEPSVRELIVPPYRLVYEYDDSHVWILTLLHTAQQFHLRRRDIRNG
jgi:toxin ParE1/3/4